MPLVSDLDQIGYFLAPGATPPADYAVGTVSRTAGTVTGAGTTFTAAMVGRTIKIGVGAATTSNTYVISAFASATSITVVSAVDGTSTPSGSDPGGTVYNISANLTIDTTARLIYLRQGNLVDSGGATLLGVYSKLKNIWRNDATAIRFLFPMTPITGESFEFQDWKPGDDTTRQLIRTGGWAEKTGSTTNREYAGIVTLGSLQASEQVYYAQVAGTTATTTNFVLTGAVNQAIQTFGDATNGNFDRRSFLALYARTQGRTYAKATLTDIGVTTMTYQVYRFPLASAVDINVANNDVTVAAYGVTVTWFAAPQSINIGGTNYNFSIIVNGNNRTKSQIYEALQYLLRQDVDIDQGTGTQNGPLVDSFAVLVGGVLTTQLVGGQGVYIQNYQAGDINSLIFTDNTGTARQFPFTASLTLNFGANLQADTNAVYRVFFTTNPAGNFGTANAVLVQDASSVNMSGNIGGAGSVSLSFAYDTNVQGGRTAGTDAAITVVAIGLGTSQYVSATGTITRSTTNSVTLTSSLERNYVAA